MNKLGSNQYKTKHKVNGVWKAYAFYVFFLLILAYGYGTKLGTHEVKIISPLAKVEAVEATPVDESLDLKSYIKTIFGRDWKVAYAVAKAESGLKPKARLVWSREYSVGIFQINLKNSTSKVHYDRIPGSTLADKQKWLENPYNNALAAYWIYKHSGWNPWTAYTSGAYEQFL